VPGPWATTLGIWGELTVIPSEQGIANQKEKKNPCRVGVLKSGLGEQRKSDKPSEKRLPNLHQER